MRDDLILSEEQIMYVHSKVNEHDRKEQDSIKLKEVC